MIKTFWSNYNEYSNDKYPRNSKMKIFVCLFCPFFFFKYSELSLRMSLKEIQISTLKFHYCH